VNVFIFFNLISQVPLDAHPFKDDPTTQPISPLSSSAHYFHDRPCGIRPIAPPQFLHPPCNHYSSFVCPLTNQAAIKVFKRLSQDGIEPMTL
jgi:hypothetical protein